MFLSFYSCDNLINDMNIFLFIQCSHSSWLTQTPPWSSRVYYCHPPYHNRPLVPRYYYKCTVAATASAAAATTTHSDAVVAAATASAAATTTYSKLLLTVIISPLLLLLQSLVLWYTALFIFCRFPFNI